MRHLNLELTKISVFCLIDLFMIYLLVKGTVFDILRDPPKSGVSSIYNQTLETLILYQI